MYNMTNLKSRVLVRGSSTWRITRFSDQLFVAKNGFGKQHTFRCDNEVISFEDYLVKQGYALREAGRGIAIVRKAPEMATA
jgi:hypothetical protein